MSESPSAPMATACDIPRNSIPANVMPPRLFHGGVAGRKVGDIIEPGHHRLKVVDGCPVCEAHASGENHPLEPATPPERVYATADKEYARWYASKAVLGWIYVVCPIGDLHLSDEDHFLSYWADTFKVVSIYERAVSLTMCQRRRLFIRWGGNRYEWERFVAETDRLWRGAS